MKVNELTALLEMQSIDYLLYGAAEVEVEGFCSLSKPRSNCITWANSAKSTITSDLSSLEDMVIVLPEPLSGLPESFVQLVVAEPRRVFFSVLDVLFPKKEAAPCIHPTAVVLSEHIGNKVSIGAHAYIGPEVEVGAGTRIGSNVSIVCPCSIGEDCILWPGVVIGSDGFGYWKDDDGVSHKVPHYGGVRIGNNAEIGANACIDRGTLDDTVIGEGAKIDNLVHIAHNCQVGANTNVIAQSGLSGSVRLNDGAYVAPHSVVLNQLSVGEDAFVGLGSVVIRDVPKKTKVFGSPAKTMRI